MVMFADKSYCLTKLGFDVALQIMKAILSAVLFQEETIEEEMPACLDDIYINEDSISHKKLNWSSLD